MPFVEPGGYSKGDLDRAGQRIRMDAGTPDDLALLDNWRASHLYVINTFQASLRLRRTRFAGGDAITIAQRLKRRPTIIDKLGREQGMSLSRMHDIAGCRKPQPISRRGSFVPCSARTGWGKASIQLHRPTQVVWLSRRS